MLMMTRKERPRLESPAVGAFNPRNHIYNSNIFLETVAHGLKHPDGSA